MNDLPSIALPCLPVGIRKDVHGEPYEDPPLHQQDQLEKLHQSHKCDAGDRTLLWLPGESEKMNFGQIRFYAAIAGLKTAIIDKGQPEPEWADIILIRK